MDNSNFVSYGKSHSPTKRVFLTYTAAVSAGYPVCYDFDNVNTYQNITDSSIALSTSADSRRLCVEKPAVGNNNHFAGVIAHNYDANTSGQWVEIYPPGTICNIKLASTADVAPSLTSGVAINQNSCQTLTFGVGKWYFKKAGLPGSGSATVLQLMSEANLCMAELQTGPQSGGYQEYTNYTGLVNASTCNSVITRGGVTEVLTAIDGTDAGGHQTISAQYYSLSAGDYVGQEKLFYVNAAAAYSLGYLIISIAMATQCSTSAVVIPSAVLKTLTARAVKCTFSTDGTNDTKWLHVRWNGIAWVLGGTGVIVS